MLISGCPNCVRKNPMYCPNAPTLWCTVDLEKMTSVALFLTCTVDTIVFPVASKNAVPNNYNMIFVTFRTL